MRLINQIQAFKDGGGLKRPNNITDDQWNKAIELYNSAIKSGDKFPELTLAQAVLETGWFKSPAGRYNYFGQKATKTQQGSTKSTNEVYGGNTVRENAKFRDYNSIDEAISDRQRLWGSKYQNAETIEEALYSIWNYNPKKQQGEGYATDPEYDIKIKSILENFGISFNARATERKPLSNTTTPSPTLTLDEILGNRISPADIWEMYKDEPTKAAELIAFKNEYEERLKKEAQEEKQAEVDLQKQALAQAQAEKQMVQKLLTTPTTPQEEYNTQIAQPQQPTQPFRFQTDWYIPQMAQEGAKIQEWNTKINFDSPFVNNDFSERRTSEEVLTPKGFLEEYIKSPIYKERLEKSGYKNVNQVVSDRLGALKDKKTFIQERPPTFFEKIKKEYKGIPYSNYGSIMSANNAFNRDKVKDYIIIDKKQADELGENIVDIMVHEFGHWEQEGHPLNKYDTDQLINRLYQPKKEHSRRPDENKSDLDAIRYKLFREGVDVFNSDITEEDLNKLNQEDFINYRMNNNYKKEDLLWLLNNIASNVNTTQNNILTAQQGGTISPLQRIKQKFQPGGTITDPISGNTNDEIVLEHIEDVILPGITITGKAPEWLQYRREFEKNNPRGLYLYDNRSRWANKQDLIDKYEREANQYVYDQLLKNNPRRKGESRGEYIQRITGDSPVAQNIMEQNKNRDSSTSENLYSNFARGYLGLSINPLNKKLKTAYEADFYAPYEREQITNSPLENIGNMADILSVPYNTTMGAWYTRGQGQDDYNMASGLSGRVPVNRNAWLEFSWDPLNAVGVGAVSKVNASRKAIQQLGKYSTNNTPLRNTTKAGNKVLNKTDDVAKTATSSVDDVGKGFKSEIQYGIDGTPDMDYKTFKNLNNQEKLKFIENVDNTIQKDGERILSELTSPEGKRRLTQQFKEMYPDYTTEEIDQLVTNRINSVTYSIKDNRADWVKALYNKKKREEGIDVAEDFLKTLDLDYYFPYKNAHYGYEKLFHRDHSHLLKDINLTKSANKGDNVITLTEKSHDPFDPEPGYITLGKGYENSVETLSHETGHAIQRGQKLPIDDELRNLINSLILGKGSMIKGLRDDIWRTFFSKSKDPIRLTNNLDYFVRGSEGKEPYPFARELRENMLQKGQISDVFEDITESKLTSFKNTEKGITGNNRLLYMIPPWDREKLAKTLNKAPVVTGVGTGLILGERLLNSQYQQNQATDTYQQAYQQGGTVSPLQRIKQKFQIGGTVRELYENITGKDWSTARAEGLTDGSYEANMRLRESLLNGVNLSSYQQTPTSTNYNNYSSFNEAFKNARQELGPNQIFEYKGKKYGTNIEGEEFDPPEQVLQDNGLWDRLNELSENKNEEFEEVDEEELKIFNEYDPIQLEGVVLDRFTRINDRDFTKNKKTIEEFQQANNLKVDGTIGPETASAILGEDLEGYEDVSFISKEREEFESKIRNAPKPSVFDGKPEWFSVWNNEGHRCLGGVCNFYEEVTGESITANVKPGTEYVDYQGNKRVYGEDAAADRLFQNRVRISNNDFENNASLLGFRQINYGNENWKAIDESVDFDLDRFKKEEPEYYQILKDAGKTPEAMAATQGLEKYVTKKPAKLKYKAEKGNMYVPRVGDIVMFRNYDSKGRHAEIIKSIDYSDKDNPVYTLYHNRGRKNSPTIPVEFTLKELHEMMSGEKGRGSSLGFDYIAIFTKDDFGGKSESEANAKGAKYADNIRKARETLLGEEAADGKKYEYKEVDVDLGSEPLTGFDTEVDTSNLPKQYNRYAIAIKKTPPSKYSDIEKTDLENLYAIALSIPSVESGFGINLKYRRDAFAQRVAPGLTETLAGGSTSAGLSRINVSRSLTEEEKEKYFIKNESKAVKKWLEGKDKSKLKDSDFTQMLVEIPELNAEITLDKLVNQYRRFKNNPDLYENRESLFWSYLALSHRSPNASSREENTEEGVFMFGPEEGSYESRAQAYVNKVLENARKIKVKIK